MPTLKRLYLSELKLKCDVISSLEFILQFTRIVESNKKKPNFKYDVTVIPHFISREKFRGEHMNCMLRVVSTRPQLFWLISFVLIFFGLNKGIIHMQVTRLVSRFIYTSVYNKVR